MLVLTLEKMEREGEREDMAYPHGTHRIGEREAQAVRLYVNVSLLGSLNSMYGLHDGLDGVRNGVYSEVINSKQRTSTVTLRKASPTDNFVHT